MKNILKVFFIFLFFSFPLFAQKLCIIALSTKKIDQSERNIFLKRFPNGIIRKIDKYYTFRLESYPTYKKASKILPKVKKYYKDAFIVNCAPLKKDSMKKEMFDKQNKNQTFSKVSLNEPSLNRIEKKLPLESLKVSKINRAPKLSEPLILKPYEIPKLTKVDKTQIYDILSFKRYIRALFEFSDKAKESFYQKKIDYLLTEIKKDYYNFDIYIDGYLLTGTSVEAQSGNAPNVNGDYTTAGVALNANKILFDGGHKLINNEYEILNKRLADIKALSAKDRLALLGTKIYSDMYLTQKELDIYEKIYNKQKNMEKIIKNGYKKGLFSTIDYIDSKNDLLNIKRAVINLKYQYLHSDFILRQSIKSRSKKPYKLAPVNIDFAFDSLAILQKEAIHNNTDIAKESNILKIKKTDLLFQKRRYYPEVRFQSYLGYGLNKDRIFNLSSPGHGVYWQAGLYFNLPIYNRDDIRLNIEKEQCAVLRQKALFSDKTREVLTQIERSYHEIKRVKEQQNILDEQLNLLYKKLKISKEKYLQGVGRYKDYSDALRSFLEYKDQWIKMEQKYIQEISILSILIGKRDFYE